MIKTEFMNLYEELSFLNEAEDPYLRAAMQMFQTDEDAKGVVVSVKPEGQSPVKVCKLYHSDEELNNITKSLYDKYGKNSNLYINAYHDRSAIEFYNNKWQKADVEEQKEAQKVIDNLFNEKLQSAMKDAGMPYLDILDDRISRDDFSALYNEYLPKNAPADGDEQDRLIKLFIKALEQKIKRKPTDQETTKETKDAAATSEEPQKAEPKNAKLNKARQNNIKIIKAVKEVGLPADDLTVTAKNKNGKDYRKASDKLNKLRKTLFGEAFDENENPFNQEF
jgi:hypothetical protein